MKSNVRIIYRAAISNNNKFKLLKLYFDERLKRKFYVSEIYEELISILLALKIMNEHCKLTN